jgi:hypothetical protein
MTKGWVKAKGWEKSLPSCFLTKIEGVPDCDSAKAGMAYFAGSGPFGETCGNCEHCGPTSHTDRKTGKVRCAMYRKLPGGGRRGETISKQYAACKYFSARPKPPSIVPSNKPQE